MLLVGPMGFDRDHTLSLPISKLIQSLVVIAPSICVLLLQSLAKHATHSVSNQRIGKPTSFSELNQ